MAPARFRLDAMSGPHTTTSCPAFLLASAWACVMTGPLITEPPAPRLASKIRGGDGGGGDVAFFRLDMPYPSPKTRALSLYQAALRRRMTQISGPSKRPSP